MYETFFGLTERPFDLTPDPRFLVLTDAHSEVLSTLEYGIASRKGITLLTGEAGSGKTMLIRAALSTQPDRVHCVVIENPMLTREEFVECLAMRFGLSDRARGSKTVLLAELDTLLRDRAARGEATVLVVDEAQTLSLELLEELRLLANIETNATKLISLVIAGQPELAARLNEPSLRQFKQRVALRCALRPLTAVEIAGYLAGRVRKAGGVGSAIFTREAVMTIHRRSGGVPRLVSVIADNALLGGYAAGIRPVTMAIVEEVCRDFDLPDVASPHSNGQAPTPFEDDEPQPERSAPRPLLVGPGATAGREAPARPAHQANPFAALGPARGAGLPATTSRHGVSIASPGDVTPTDQPERHELPLFSAIGRKRRWLSLWTRLTWGNGVKSNGRD